MTVLAGRYALGELLGSGGMSRVHVAVDELLHRRVAVKLIREDLAADPIVRERLLREARAAASFAHPNAVGVYDTGEDDGIPFIVMELVEGETLADRLRASGPMSVEETRRIAGDVLSALAAAHARGLVHRDVKPANVLLPADGSGAKLADFGIAKEIRQAAEGLTMTGQVLGTPRYLSPEQTAGHQATPQSDLYAVGVVCFEMLDGSAPFSGSNAVAVAMAHQIDEPPSLTESRPDIPADLAAAVHRALAKRPSERFATAEGMRAAVTGTTALAGADLAATQVLGALDTTQVVGGGQTPHGGAPSDAEQTPTRPASSTLPVLAIVGALVLLAVMGVALSRTLGDDDTVPAAAPTEPAADPEPADDAEPAAVEPEPAPEPDPEPEPEPEDSIQALMLELARDPDAAGEKGEDLLDDLEDLLDTEAKDRPKEARAIIREVSKWLREDKLESATGERAIALLEPVAQEQRGGADRDDEADDD